MIKEEEKRQKEEKLRALPVSQLKALMSKHNVDFSNCIEKSDMVRLCLENELSPEEEKAEEPTQTTTSINL